MSSTQACNPTTTYKLIIAGDGGVGKTTFIARHKTGEFRPKYIPTVGAEVCPLKFHTSDGPIIFNTWDVAGMEKYHGLRDGYFVGGECAIVMYDVDRRSPFAHVADWIRNIRNVCGEIPIVVCGNKIDVISDNDKVSNEEISDLIREQRVRFYQISAKSNYNFEKPFLELARILHSSPTLQFVEAVSPVTPPILQMTPQSCSEFAQIDHTPVSRPQPQRESHPLLRELETRKAGLYSIIRKAFAQIEQIELLESTIAE
jgi:GTP-binding nuclear protein Ran